jgi:UDP-2,3-diacylglucosamine hydrolase
MSSAYFFSDVHFGVEGRTAEREKESRVLSFLDHVMQNADQLYIVGDLFDAWIEYETAIPKGFHRILTRLEDVVRKGIVVHYLAGNHDFWMRDYFSAELGMITHLEPFDTVIDGKKYLIHHGDGLALRDAGYRFIKPILRSKLSVAFYRWIHPDIGLAIARSSSKQSRHYTSGKDYGEHDGMIQFASAKIAGGYYGVIMGHRHEPFYSVIDNGVYVNLGDWLRHNSYAVAKDGIVSLHSWKEHS